MTSFSLVTPVGARTHASAQALRNAAIATLAVLLLLPLLQIAAATGSALGERVATTAEASTLGESAESSRVAEVSVVEGSGLATTAEASAPLTYSGSSWAAISDGSGVAVATGNGAFDLRTAAIAGTELSAVEPVRDGELLTFDHGEVTEWWRTVGNGLEQGWTFYSAPAGSDGTLTVDVAVTGAFTAVAESATSVRLVGEGQTLWYRDLASWDATGRDLPSTMSVVDGQIRIDVDATGAVYPVTVDPILTEDQKIEPPDGTAQDNWGTAVDIDGLNAIVAVPGEDVTGRNAGRVVFYRDNGVGAGWAFEQATNGGLGSDAGYGEAVALATDPLVDPDPGSLPNYDRAIALIGAPRSDLNGTDSGAVDVYSYDPAIPGGWQLVTSIFACDQPSPGCDIKSAAAAPDAPGALFGSSIDLQHIGGSSWLAAIGAPGSEQVHYVDFDMTLSGRTLATGFDADLREILTPIDAAGNPFNSPGFGSDVDMRWGPNDAFSSTETDQYYIVGTGNDAFPNFDTDSAYVFQRQDGAAPLLVETIPDFGRGHGRVAVANDVVAVADEITQSAGEVRIFTNAFDSSVSLEVEFVDSSDLPASVENKSFGNFGSSIDLAPLGATTSLLTVGGPGLNQGPDAARTGIAYQFEIDVIDISAVLIPTVTRLAIEADPTTPLEQTGAAMGSAVATDGTNWIVGAPGWSEVPGSRDGEAQIGPISSAPTALARLANPQLDRFGSSIDIDGDLMVVGAPGRDSPGGEQGGEAFVYVRNAGVWGSETTLRPTFSEEPYTGFGVDVGILSSAAGDFIVVGGTDAGSFFPSVWAFKLNTATSEWEQTDQLGYVSGFAVDTSENWGEAVAIVDHPVDGPTIYVGGSDPVAGEVGVFVWDVAQGFFTSKLDGGGTAIRLVGSPSFGSAIDAAANTTDAQVIVAIGAPDETFNGTIFRYVDVSGSGLQNDGSYTRVPFTGPEGIGATVAVDPITFNLTTVSPSTGELTLLKDGDTDNVADVALLESQTEFGASTVDPGFDSVSPGASGFVASLDNYVIAPTVDVAIAATPGVAMGVFEPAGTGWTRIDSFRSIDTTAGDQLGWATVWSPDGTVALGAPGDDGPVSNIEPDAGAVYIYNDYLPAVAPDDPTLNFTFDLAPGSAPTVGVAPSGVAATEFDAATIEAAAENETSIAASPLGAIDLEDAPLGAIGVEGSPLGAIAFGDPTLDLAAIILADPDLAGLPLVDVGIAGGWETVVAGTPLALEPINNLTLGDVLSNATASGNLAASPLGAIEINGTPLGAIPLGAIALGATPLGAIPLGAIGFSTDAELCAALGIPAGSCSTDLDNTTALEASIQGAPLGAIPLGAIPLGAIDIADTPLGAIPLGAIELEQSPLGAIPLGAIPLGAIELDQSPLGAIPLGAIPLGAIPLGAIPLGAIDVNGTPLGAIPLGAIPLGAIPTAAPLGAIPLGAIDVADAPLGAIPLGAIALADVPLGAIPLGAIAPNTAANDAAWCDLLADIDAGYDCENGGVDADTTIFDLMVQGVPLGAIPLGAIPLGAIDVDGAPLGAIPLGAIALEDAPLGAIPLGAIPLGAIDLAGTPLGAIPLVAAPVDPIPLGAIPLGAIPLGAIDVAGSPLGAIPLGAIDVAGTPLGAIPLGAIPLGAIPLGAIPLGAIDVAGSPLGAIPLGAIDVTGSPLGAIPLGAITVDGAPLGAIPLGAIDCGLVDCGADTLADAITAGAADGLLLEDFAVLDGLITGLTIGEIVDAVGATEADFSFAASHDTLGEIDAAEMILGDIPADVAELDDTSLQHIEAGLYAVTFADLVSALSASEADSQAALATAFAALGLTLDDFDVLGNVTLEDLIAGADGGLTLAELGRILGLVHVADVLAAFDPDAELIPGLDLDAIELNDLTVEELGDLTLFDLIGLINFDEITLADLFLALDEAGVLDGYTFSDLLVALVAADELPFEGLDFTEVEVADLPPGTVEAVAFRAEIQITDSVEDHAVELTVDLPGTASYVAGSGTVGDPTITGNRLSWLLTDVAPATLTDISFEIRPTVSLGVTELDATARIVGFDDTSSGVAAVNVAEGLEPNDFPAVTTAVENTIYLTYITSSTDNDVFAIDVADNDQLAVSLTGLTADLDVALYVAPDNAAATQALSDVSDEAPLVPITDPDQEGADTEPLQDFRRLDLEDPTLELIEVSNSAGTESELIVTDRLIAGTYYLQVFGANGATNIEPAALQVQKLEAEAPDPCAASGIAASTNLAADTVSGTPNTAILVNYHRLEQLYSPAERNDVETALNNFVGYLNGAGSGLGIDPLVIDLDGLQDVRSAYTAWDTDASLACDPVAANAIVDAIITNAIDPIRGSLDHVMIIGDDAQIPMARLADETTVANEYDFRHEFLDDGAEGAGTTNAFTATFWNRVYLSDEPYGESAARDLGDRFLYVSDLALGRLVETPAEITAQLATFETFNGELDITTGEVLGYDFLSDGSAEIAADLAAGLTGGVDDELADGVTAGGDLWDRDDAIAALTTGAADILSLNAHFDHYRALPADEGTLLETDNVLTGINVDIVFSMGCHGGLHVSDVQVANTNQDWAQTFAQNQSVFIGNTGFGYGDTETVAYTERLLALFAEEVVRPFGDGADKTSIGQALTFAKNRFVSDLATFSVYDEKAVMESTFYGIPFYTVGITGEALPPAPTNTTTPDATGLESLGETVGSANDPQVTGLGTYYSNPDSDGGDEQVITVPGYPVQPSLSTDISVVDGPDTSVLAQVAHGAIVTGMTSQYVQGIDPVVAGAIYDEVAAAQGEPELGDVVFPAKPVTINTATTPAGERQTLVTATGQFASSGSTQRLDDDIDVVVYYSSPGDTDFTPPTIGLVDSTLEGSQFTVSLDVSDPEGAVERVLVLVVEDPGTGNRDWIPVELQQISGTDQWSGSATVTASEVEFLVQAVDGSGNVGFATNKARNFNDDVTPEPEPPTPDVDATENPANLDPNGTGWYTGDATVDVEVTNSSAEFSVDGSAYQPLTGSNFQITGDGIHTWSVRLATGDQEIDGIVRIDTTGAPVVEIAPPADGAVYSEDAVPTLSFLCSDPSLQSCTVTINGIAAELGDPLPTATGVTHSVTVSGTDVFNDTTTVTHSYTVTPVAGGNAPVIVDSMVENIAATGETTDVTVEFTGDAGVTATIDWGDGTVTAGTVMDPTGTSPGVVDGSHTYAAGGVYTITVTLTAPGGATTSVELVTASCTKIGTPGNDVINGTTGDDVLCGLGGNDRINGLAGNDIIYGGAGRDRLYGNSGNDIIFGGRDRDLIYGGGQDDLLIGGRGNDYLNGQAGHDVLLGRLGPDSLIGGSGNDELYGQRGNDYISGQSGNDFARGGRGNDRMYGSGGDDELRGGAGNDLIYGGGNADDLHGGAGDDKLYGQSGPDDINGGADQDLCRGGGGANNLTNCEL